MTEHGKAHDPEKLSSQKSKIAKDSSCLRENNRERHVRLCVVFLNRLIGITNHTLRKSNFYEFTEIICFRFKRKGWNHMCLHTCQSRIMSTVFFLIYKLDLCRAWEQQIIINIDIAERKKKCLHKCWPSPPRKKNDCVVFLLKELYTADAWITSQIMRHSVSEFTI